MSATGFEKTTERSSVTAKASAPQPRVSIEPVHNDNFTEKDGISTFQEVGTNTSISNGGNDDDDEEIDEESEEYASIPELVRNVVSFKDDPTLPVITFRSILLSVVFCVIGSFVSQLS